MCIGPKLNEELIVKHCQGYRNVFNCIIEVREPTALQTVQHMIAVHYNHITLKGESDSQRFVKTQTGSRVQLLDCDVDIHDKQDISICELLPWSPKCEKAVSTMNKADVMSHCNFTRHEKFPPGTITADKGILVQGTDVKTKIRRGTDIRLLSSDSPIIVYSNAEIVIEEKGESYIHSGSVNVTGDEVILSALDEKDIAALERTYYWQNFWENLDMSDYIDIVLIFVEIALAPLTIMGFIFGYRSSHRKSQGKFKGKRDVFSYNQSILKQRRPSPKGK